MTTERTAAAWREPQIAEPYVLSRLLNVLRIELAGNP
jgi:hypothetical protein